MLSSRVQARAKKNLGVILQAAEKSRLTVDRLSSYTRPPRDAEKSQTVKLADVIDDALALLQQRILSSDFEVETSIECEARIRAVPLDVYSVVNNLIVNSMDALGAEPPPRKIKIRLLSDSGWAVLSVEDNGPGVPLAIQDKIFEPFFTTKPVGLGMGLGLHLCKQVLTNLGGRLELKPSSLGGACFVAHFPV
ncbi:MAG TPA: hypothetical protein EYO33_32560 [Phycisphaerales bacterium]|nr:hypothetical protein [Phycisphaerales bacterium]